MMKLKRCHCQYFICKDGDKKDETMCAPSNGGIGNKLKMAKLMFRISMERSTRTMPSDNSTL